MNLGHCSFANISALPSITILNISILNIESRSKNSSLKTFKDEGNEASSFKYEDSEKNNQIIN